MHAGTIRDGETDNVLIVPCFEYTIFLDACPCVHNKMKACPK
jgi:hypothetical protein